MAQKCSGGASVFMSPVPLLEGKACAQVATRWSRIKESSGKLKVRNPIPPMIRPAWDLLHVKTYLGAQTSCRWCGAEVLRGDASSGGGAQNS
ncbi:hypothetical protein AVEN_267964-1 [Araneus ventricosus]|uniref:Uncharacterized protein n=1 Tax=Araneus ventricosus TaxID=182803 RepID=A0A4Y2SHH6_ARAVE|nr:hypothetical protein AVEN_267964-1 [Araneus ventricosus]